MAGCFLGAARLPGAAEIHRDRIGAPLTPRERPEYQAELAGYRARAGEAHFCAAWEEGIRLSLEEAMTEAERLLTGL
jgi:hypothetical protein